MNMLMQPTNTTESTNLPYFCMGEFNLFNMHSVSEIATNPSYLPFKEKFKKITSLFGYLKYGEAFILKPWILLGGTDKPENYVIGNLSTYLDLVSQTLNK